MDEIPGVGVTAAAVIIAEVGEDMTRFPTPAHLSSWPGSLPAQRAYLSGPLRADAPVRLRRTYSVRSPFDALLGDPVAISDHGEDVRDDEGADAPD